jgi:hypothetical protein
LNHEGRLHVLDFLFNRLTRYEAVRLAEQFASFNSFATTLTSLVLQLVGLFAANGSEEHALSFRELVQDTNVDEARSLVDSQDVGTYERIRPIREVL